MSTTQVMRWNILIHLLFLSLGFRFPTFGHYSFQNRERIPFYVIWCRFVSLRLEKMESCHRHFQASNCYHASINFKSVENDSYWKRWACSRVSKPHVLPQAIFFFLRKRNTKLDSRALCLAQACTEIVSTGR